MLLKLCFSVDQGSGTFLAQRAIKVAYVKMYLTLICTDFYFHLEVSCN